MRWNSLARCAAFAALQTSAGLAQENAPIGFLRGDLMAWAGSARAGEVTFRNSDSRVYQCSFDAKTYFERGNQRITAAAMQQGDRLELLADHKDGSSLCYARTIQVLDVQQIRTLPGQRPRLRTSSGPTEIFAPRGDLTFAGVVVRVSPDALVLRTRNNEHKTILLRPDTRYLTGGQAMERSNLDISTRVFIRAGKNLEGGIEAYQVMWGDILEP